MRLLLPRYANAPSSLAAELGGCGGGSFRELRVWVDGVLAGAALPFPVVYSGGIDPLLWRPLAGIESFDIPPYRFDLTPFAGALNDGAAHNFSIDVVGNSPTGVWCDGRLSARCLRRELDRYRRPSSKPTHFLTLRVGACRPISKPTRTPDASRQSSSSSSGPLLAPRAVLLSSCASS